MKDETRKMHCIHYHSSFAPVYYLHGARPLILDLEPQHSGQMDGILLNRDGDCAILPIQTHITNLEKQTYHTQTDPQTIALTLHDLQQAGWQNFGHITITIKDEI